MLDYQAFQCRGSKIRTHINGFGDRCSTLELYPYRHIYYSNKLLILQEFYIELSLKLY